LVGEKLDSAVGKVDSEAGKLDSGARRLNSGSGELEKKAGGSRACRLARARACQHAREGQRACACRLAAAVARLLLVLADVLVLADGGCVLAVEVAAGDRYFCIRCWRRPVLGVGVGLLCVT